MTMMTKPTTAIIDGDIIAYRSAYWADGEGIDDLPARIKSDLKKWTPSGCDEAIVAMSCPREYNYRREFWPKYKAHREGFTWSDRPTNPDYKKAKGSVPVPKREFITAALPTQKADTKKIYKDFEKKFIKLLKSRLRK